MVKILLKKDRAQRNLQDDKKFSLIFQRYKASKVFYLLHAHLNIPYYRYFSQSLILNLFVAINSFLIDKEISHYLLNKFSIHINISFGIFFAPIRFKNSKEILLQGFRDLINTGIKLFVPFKNTANNL